MKAHSKNSALVIGVVVALLLFAVLLGFYTSSNGPTVTDSGSAADTGMAEMPTQDEPAPAPAESAPAKSTSTSGKRPTALRLVSAMAERDPSAGPGVFEGQVVSWSSGQGVADAELTFAHGGVVTGCRTDDSGRFRFEPAESGRFELAVVTADGYLPFAPEWGHSPVQLLARPGIRVRDITVSLRPAIDYRGVVLSPQDTPVAGARVSLLSTPGGQTDLVPLQESFVTDGEGAFTFHAPDDALLEARHADFSPGRARLDTAAQVSHRLVIRLEPPGQTGGNEQISGSVVDGDGEAMDGVLVTGRFDAENPATAEAARRNSAQVLTDEQGRFTLDGLDGGHYRVTASRAGYAPARARDVAAGTDDLRLALHDGATLRGSVREAESGAPIAGFSVVVMLQVGALQRETYATATVFDSEGRYEIGGLAPGQYAVVALANEHAPSKARDVAVPDPLPDVPLEADFTLGGGGRLTGKVIDSRSRRPLEHARVSAEASLGSSASAIPLMASTTTDAAGEFELRGLTGGLRSIFVAAHNHNSRIISGLTVEANGDVGPITVDLRPVAEGEEPTVELTGIGAVLAVQDDALVLGRTIAGGGAAEAGLRPGDGILAVNGASVVELGFQGSIERIRGPEGSTVVLTVRRGETGEVVDISVPRRRITTS